jgi:hypothetical protein
VSRKEEIIVDVAETGERLGVVVSGSRHDPDGFARFTQQLERLSGRRAARGDKSSNRALKFVSTPGR